MATITKLASTNSVAAALFDMIKGEKFIFCRSNRLYGKTAIGEGLSILTTNNNYGIIMRLNGMLPPNAISHYYQIRSKMIKKQMNPNSQPVPPMTTTYNHPVQTSIWDLPLSITTTTGPILATATPILYKSAV